MQTWIKMRSDLHSDPKVLVMGRLLFGDGDTESDTSPSVTRVTGVAQRVTSLRVTPRNTIVTHVTVSALLQVWAAISRVIDEENYHPFLRLSDLDQITGLEGFGAAMEYIGWVEETADRDGLVFPNFQEFNTPAKVRRNSTGKRSSSAERQARYRERKRQQAIQDAPIQPPEVTDSEASRVTRNVARNAPLREEKGKNKKNNPPPPSPSERPAVMPGDRRVTDQAAAELISLGVEFPRQAVEPALANGATLADIRALCDHFRSCPGAWDAGALQRRVRGFVAGQPPDKGWPEPDPKYRRDQRISQQSQQARQETAQREEQRERDKWVRRQRELRHAAKFDALDGSQLRDLIRELFGGEQFALATLMRAITHDEQGFRNSPSYRDQVFQRLDLIDGHTAAAS